MPRMAITVQNISVFRRNLKRKFLQNSAPAAENDRDVNRVGGRRDADPVFPPDLARTPVAGGFQVDCGRLRGGVAPQVWLNDSFLLRVGSKCRQHH